MFWQKVLLQSIIVYSILQLNVHMKICFYVEPKILFNSLSIPKVRCSKQWRVEWTKGLASISNQLACSWNPVTSSCLCSSLSLIPLSLITPLSHTPSPLSPHALSHPHLSLSLPSLHPSEYPIMSYCPSMFLITDRLTERQLICQVPSGPLSQLSHSHKPAEVLRFMSLLWNRHSVLHWVSE